MIDSLPNQGRQLFSRLFHGSVQLCTAALQNDIVCFKIGTTHGSQAIPDPNHSSRDERRQTRRGARRSRMDGERGLLWTACSVVRAAASREVVSGAAHAWC